MLALSFYARDALIVARELLGKTLVVNTAELEQRVRIVETEAYLGPHDLAAHTSKGRTRRTEVIFGPAGHAYVYLIYGMYDMLNIVVGKEDGQAVLIRAAEPLQAAKGKTDGPGKLTRTLGITRAHNGHRLDKPPLYLETGGAVPEIVTTTRIGVDYAGEWKDAPLRFYDAESSFVSKYVSKR